MSWWLIACVAPTPDSVLAWQLTGSGYEIVPRVLPELTDAAHMVGTLGTIRYGGRLADSGGFDGGRELDVRYVLDDGVAVPLDSSGVILYSFYAHLADVVVWADERGFAASPLLPVPIAVNPAVNLLLEISPADNLAYATGYHAFLLLPDGGERDVPLAANLGVVAHEFGHALFHALLSGSPERPPLVGDSSSAQGRWMVSLHEGFADILGALITDDPRFIRDSLDVDSRDLDAGWVLTDTLVPKDGGSALELYDPYPLGTVFAATFWDVRVASDDPDRTARLVLDAVEAWDPDPATLHGRDLLAAAVDVSGMYRLALCTSIGARFPEDYWPEHCGLRADGPAR